MIRNYFLIVDPTKIELPTGLHIPVLTTGWLA